MIYPSFILLAIFLFALRTFICTAKRSKSYITLLGLASVRTIILFIIWTLSGSPATILSTSWYKTSIVNLKFSVTLDFYSIVFFTVGLYVTWSIVEFAHYYMTADPKTFRFINTLILFLLFMLILVSAKRIFILFVGWEGVGIMSFILISWWYTRQEAKRSALQAVIYKRIGDRGVLITMAISAYLIKSWELKRILTQTRRHTSWIIAIGLIVAATGKSAQFTLHPWLPSAMEGPTPVSALLHRSTMVVAGVFLLIRTTPILKSTSWAMTIIGLIGSTTAIFAARVALTQKDFKKVVAYSTTSQLGLMVLAIRINYPLLALFHICTHAFFKALLFLCSGRVIHSFKKEQDLRKIRTAAVVTPFTTAAIVVASLALSGLPFLAGFYSKDLILEMSQTRKAKTLRAFLGFTATLLTAIYTLRTLFFILYPTKRTAVISPIKEEKYKLDFSLMRLIIGATISGWLFSLVLFNSSPVLLPLSLKKIPLILLIIALTLLVIQNINVKEKAINSFLATNWFFVQITHTLAPLSLLVKSVKGVLRTFDHGWLNNLSNAVVKIIKKMILFTQKSFKSHIKRYVTARFFIFLVFLIVLRASQV